MSKEIIYITAPLCPKCVRVNRFLKVLEKTNPDVKITKYNIITNSREIKKYNVKTIPTLIIGEEKLDGWISEEKLRNAIQKMKG